MNSDEYKDNEEVIDNVDNHVDDDELLDAYPEEIVDEVDDSSFLNEEPEANNYRYTSKNKYAKENNTKDEAKGNNDANNLTRGRNHFNKSSKQAEPAVKGNSLENKGNNASEKMKAINSLNKSGGNSTLKPGLPTMLNKNDGSSNIKENLSEVISDKIKNTIKSFILKHPLVLLWVGIAFIFLLILLLFMGGNHDSSTGGGYFDKSCNFNETNVIIKSCISEETVDTVSLKDYIMGTIYSYFKDNNLNEDQTKALIMIFKTNTLSHDYNNTTKEIIVDDCSYGYTLPANMNGSDLEDISIYYDELENYLYLPSTYTSTITYLGSDVALTFNSDIMNQLVSSTGDYESILTNLYPDNGYQIYDLALNCTYYTLTANESYWWPIGSSSPTNGNIYGGEPASGDIIKEFGWQNGVDGREYNPGIIIGGNDDDLVNVIASKEGTIKAITNTCTTTSDCTGYGNTILIEHNNGTETFYAYLDGGSITLNVGDQVSQGEKIGTVSKNGDSWKLHFEVRVSNKPVDPSDYVSLGNARPTNVIQIEGYGSDEGGKQNVCKALIESGLSKNAVVGIMINIAHESSGFTTNNLEGCYEKGRCCTIRNQDYGYCVHPEIGDFGSDEAYTLGVDNGEYPRDYFVNDHAGYGLIQWTSSGRKAGLYDYSKNSGLSIASLNVQLNYLFEELKRYPTTYKYIMGNYTAAEIGKVFCTDFERPASGETGCQKRVDDSLEEYTRYVNAGCN